MWPFKCKSKQSENIGSPLEDFKLPGDEMAQLFQQAVRELGEEQAVEFIFERCDFRLARDEIANFFMMADSDAQRGGKDVVYKTEYVQGWRDFSANPNPDTARAWLDAAPEYKDMIHSYLVECCPGGKFAFYGSIKRPSNDEKT